jgi:hypothetical protein
MFRSGAAILVIFALGALFLIASAVNDIRKKKWIP